MLSRNCNWTRIGVVVLLVLFISTIYAQYNRNTGISRAINSLMQLGTSNVHEGLHNDETTKSQGKQLASDLGQKKIKAETIAKIKEYYWDMYPKVDDAGKIIQRLPEDNETYGMYFKWETDNVTDVTKMDILTLNHQTGTGNNPHNLVLKVYYEKDETITPPSIHLKVGLFKDVKGTSTLVNKGIPLTDTNSALHTELSMYSSNRLVISRNSSGHYMLWINCIRSGDPKNLNNNNVGVYTKFALDSRNVNGADDNYPDSSDFDKCDSLNCVVDLNGKLKDKTGLSKLKLDSVTLGDSLKFTEADIAFDKQYTSSLFSGNGTYVWQELYGDCDNGKRHAIPKCVKAGTPHMDFSHLVKDMEPYTVDDSICDGDPALSRPNVTNMPDMKCIMPNDTRECHPCSIVQFVEEDVKKQPANSAFWNEGMALNDLKDLARKSANIESSTEDGCEKCIIEQIDNVGGPVTLESPLFNVTSQGKNSGKSLMFNCGGNFQSEMGTTIASQLDFVSECTKGGYKATDKPKTRRSGNSGVAAAQVKVDAAATAAAAAKKVAKTKTDAAAEAEAAATAAAAAEGTTEADKAAADAAKVAADAAKVIANKDLADKLNKLAAAKQELVQAQNASSSSSSSSTVPTPASTTSSSTGATFLGAFGNIMGGASSTSSWLPAWASTDDNKSKTIQVVDDNYNVFVDTGRGGGGRRGYGHGRYATGGVWDDLYGMSAASTSSYDCQNLNTQRKFDTMNRRCQNMWLNIYGKELEDCYKYVKRGHAWSTIPRRCKNLLSSYFSLSRDGYDNTRLSQLAMKDYETNEVTNYTYCNTFCKNNPCTKQCKRWNCSNCVGVDSVDASEITEAVNAAKDIWKDKKANHYSSMQRLWYMGDNGRTGRSYHHFPDNLKGVDDNDLDINTYQSAVPISELRAW